MADQKANAAAVRTLVHLGMKLRNAQVALVLYESREACGNHRRPYLVRCASEKKAVAEL